MARYNLDVMGLEEVVNRFSGERTEQAINEYFEGDAFTRITPHIQGLIHASGRTFKGHATSATAAASTTVFGKENSNLSLTIKSKGKYRYLYFPDDGSNTKHHAGNQHFMTHGAEQALPQVSEDLVKRIVQAFEEA